MPTPEPLQPIPTPTPDVIRPPTPEESPVPDIPGEIPVPGPEIVTPPEPRKTPPPTPSEAPPQTY